MLFSAYREMRGNRIALVTQSGGAGILMADKCEEVGLEVPELPPETQARLASIVPAFGSTKNPVDVTAEMVSRPNLVREALEVLLAEPMVDALVIFLGGLKGTGPLLAKDIAQVASNARKPVLVAWMAAPREAWSVLRSNGVPIFPDAVRCVKALGKLLRFSREKPSAIQSGAGQPDPRALALVARARRDGFKTLGEDDSKRLLRYYGIPLPRESLAKTVQQAVAAANEIGFPVAMKVVSPDIPHKTDCGCVALSIENAQEVEESFERIMTNASRIPEARISGVLVQEMVQGVAEVIVGMKRDPVLGPAIMFGLGGIFVEVLGDTSTRVAPITRQEALAMIDEVKGVRLLKGYRGGQAADIESLAEVLVRVSLMAMQIPELEELDINPLVIMGKGSKAVDALVVLGGGSEE